MYILTLGFIFHCLLLLPDSFSAERLIPKNLTFWGNKTSMCAVITYWAHCPVVVYLFCYVHPKSFPQAGVDRKDLISVSTKGKFITHDKTHMRASWTWLGCTSSGLMQLVFPNLLAWGKTQADTLQRTFHLIQSYATDLSSFSSLTPLATNGLNSAMLFLKSHSNSWVNVLIIFTQLTYFKRSFNKIFSPNQVQEVKKTYVTAVWLS